MSCFISANRDEIRCSVLPFRFFPATYPAGNNSSILKHCYRLDSSLYQSTVTLHYLIARTCKLSLGNDLFPVSSSALGRCSDILYVDVDFFF